MKTLPLVLRLAACSAALFCIPQPASADTLYWDTTTSAGITNSSGTWDTGTTASWSASIDGSNPLLTWSAGDTAAFTINTTGSNTVTLSGSVSVGGLEVSGTGGGNTTIAATGGDSLVLAGDQTWSTTALRTNGNGASIIISAPISGTANLTFDGRGVSKSTDTASNGVLRASFALSGANTYVGTTTVTKGAALVLDYRSDAGSKLDDSSALVLAGGSLVLNGGSNVVEVVGSTELASGANTIYIGSFGGAGSTNRIALGAITHDVGATLDFTPNLTGLASTTTQNTNGIIGGWATSITNRWAVGSADGSDTIVTNTVGSTVNTEAGFVSTANANLKASFTGLGSKTVNVLRFDTSGSYTLGLASDATLTVNAGGILAAGTGASITGGKITTGLSTGELFVHTPNDFTIGSAIVDNGSTKTILVKAGTNALTLTGQSTHTGGTIINSGAVNLAAGASLGSANITLDGGSFAMDAASSITFNIAGTGAGQFDVFKSNLGTASLAGSLFFKFDSVIDGSWQLISLADADSAHPDISGSIVVTGVYGDIALTDNGSGVWTGLDAEHGASFTFTESTGFLDVSLAAIPEPATAALFIGFVSLVVFALRRRRRSV